VLKSTTSLIIFHLDAKSNLEDESQRLYKKAEVEVKKNVSMIQKKLNQVERDLRNKTRLLMDKKNNTSLRQSQLKSSKGSSEDPLAASKRNNDKLKARVTNLEKSYEMMKTKCKTLEEQLDKERSDRNKYQEDYYKMKSKKTISDKENKDLKDKMIQLELQLGHAANQISILEHNTTRVTKRKDESPDIEDDMMVQDLDDSQEFDTMLNIIPETNMVSQSIQKFRKPAAEKKTPKKHKTIPKPKVSEIQYKVGSTEESNLFIELNCLVMTTMSMTLPIIIESSIGANVNDASFLTETPNKMLDRTLGDSQHILNCSPRNLNDEYSLADITCRDENQTQKPLNFGEVLFPAFNRLTPKLSECLIVSRYVCETNKGIQGLLQLTWNCISFSFDTHVLSKVVERAIQKKIGNSYNDSDVRMFDNSLEESKMTEYKHYSPLELDFTARTTLVKKKLKELHSKSKAISMMSRVKNDTLQLPIYTLFKDAQVNELLVDTILSIISPSKPKDDDKENTNMTNHQDPESSQKLRNSSKLRRSQNRASVKEDSKPVIHRDDKISIQMKLLGCSMINTLSLNTKNISKVLSIIEDLISVNHSEDETEQA